MPEIVPEKQARQGAKGKPVLYVLIASLVLLAIAITGLMTWQGANAPPDHAAKSQNSSRGEVTGSVNGGTNAPSSNTGNVPASNPSYPNPAQPSANPKPN